MEQAIRAHSPTSALTWALIIATLGGLAAFYLQGIRFLVQEWSSPEYGHGVLIPLISLGIIWLKRNQIAALANGGSWIGLPVLALALLIGSAGAFATIYLIVHVSIVLALMGVALCFLGLRATLSMWFPILYLFFMIPLPDFLLVQISAELQLLTSSTGVWIIRLFGITVFLDGNVIDMGDFKMQVVEACSGLRYLFPLMSFGMLVAYLYSGPFWQRLALFLSTIPITLFMNMVRIALIGIVYDYYGIDAANGALHDFQGWAIFIVCLFLLLIEVMLLSKLVRGRPRFFELFSLRSTVRAH